MRGRTLVLSLFLACVFAPLEEQKAAVEWPVYGGDQEGTKYSPLTDITAGNLSRLRVAWEWKTGETARAEFGTRPGLFQNTPLMIDGVLYVSTPYIRVVALDADTGAERWMNDAKAYEDGQPPNGTGFVHLGIAAWRDGDRLPVFLNSRHRLISLDARMGTPAFGQDGVVDLTQGPRWAINRRHLTNTSPPIVFLDLVIVGNGVADRLTYRNDPPGDVRSTHERASRCGRSARFRCLESLATTHGRRTLHRTHQRVGADDTGRAARLALPLGVDAEP